MRVKRCCSRLCCLWLCLINVVLNKHALKDSPQNTVCHLQIQMCKQSLLNTFVLNALFETNYTSVLIITVIILLCWYAEQYKNNLIVYMFVDLKTQSISSKHCSVQHYYGVGKPQWVPLNVALSFQIETLYIHLRWDQRGKLNWTMLLHGNFPPSLFRLFRPDQKRPRQMSCNWQPCINLCVGPWLRWAWQPGNGACEWSRFHYR